MPRPHRPVCLHWAKSHDPYYQQFTLNPQDALWKRVEIGSGSPGWFYLPYHADKKWESAACAAAYAARDRGKRTYYTVDHFDQYWIEPKYITHGFEGISPTVTERKGHDTKHRHAFVDYEKCRVISYTADFPFYIIQAGLRDDIDRMAMRAINKHGPSGCIAIADNFTKDGTSYFVEIEDVRSVSLDQTVEWHGDPYWEWVKIDDQAYMTHKRQFAEFMATTPMVRYEFEAPGIAGAYFVIRLPKDFVALPAAIEAARKVLLEGKEQEFSYLASELHARRYYTIDPRVIKAYRHSQEFLGTIVYPLREKPLNWFDTWTNRSESIGESLQVVDKDGTLLFSYGGTGSVARQMVEGDIYPTVTADQVRAFAAKVKTVRGMLDAAETFASEGLYTAARNIRARARTFMPSVKEIDEMAVAGRVSDVTTLNLTFDAAKSVDIVRDALHKALKDIDWAKFWNPES